MKKFLSVILLALLATSANAEVIRPTTTAEFAQTSVKITNLAGNSGGTGVIYRSEENHSLIVTNKHVCGILVHGGLVQDYTGQNYPVTGFQTSRIHDLCLVTVMNDLGVDTVLASEAPEIYSKAFVSGHPHLLPHVLTRGDFSGRVVVPIQVGVTPCTPDQMKKSPMQCFFGGGIPIVEKYDSQLVTATILPGSSGSGVFNEDGELSGLVFASDSRELAYALIVPYDYVAFFLTKEITTIPRLAPTPEVESPLLNLPHGNRNLFEPLLFSEVQQYTTGEAREMDLILQQLEDNKVCPTNP